MVTHAPNAIAGLVLAGGRSRRFGADKALAQIGDRSLLELSLARFAACTTRAVSVRADGAVAEHARALCAEVIRDARDAVEGPLAGIAAGVRWARETGCALLAVAPCDAPLLAWSHYQRLLRNLGSAPAAFAVTAAGQHPLCAVWRVDLLARLEKALAGGQHPAIHRFLHENGAAAVRFEDAASFANVNDADELERIVLETGA